MLDKIRKSVSSIKKHININRFKYPLRKRVFCISIQRNGTTSVGDFLKDHGYKVAGWGESNVYNWPYLISVGNYEAVFNSKVFKAYNAFEDSPWFYGDIYRILFHRFPKSKFILLYRDSEAWFDSMIYHSGGKTLGNTYRHCKFYKRLSEYYERLDTDPDFNPTENTIDNLMSLKGKKDHYIQIYKEYNRDVIEFFDRYGADRLFVGKLEDPDKWKTLGQFLNLPVVDGYSIHSNKSDPRMDVNQ